MKKRVIIIVAILLLVTGIGLSYAYFRGIISGEGVPISITTKDVKIIYTDDLALNAGAIEPGWTHRKNFSIKNESSSTYKYNIVFEGLINTFVTEGYLQYKITSNNGGYNMSEFIDIPKSETPTDTPLAIGVDIDGNITQDYTIEFIYKTTEEDQSADMGKALGGKISIVEFIDNSLKGLMLAHNEISTRTDFSQTLESETTGTIFQSTEDGEDVYYYAGNTTNNWVSFAGYLWRIIRSNKDGSVRLLYAGSGGEDGFIGTSAFNQTSTHPGYVGFKYATGSTLEGIRGETESTILTELNKWYDTNLVNKNDGKNIYDTYVSKTAVYCNDRELAPGSSFSTSKSFYYAARGRLETNKTPTYNCTNEADRFTGSNLTHPVGLMTADEVSFAGGLYYTNNSSAYYHLNKTGGSATGSTYWWTMSPYWYNSNANVFFVYGSSNPGYLYTTLVNNANGIRPVISISDCASFTGTGTADDPYTLNPNNSTCKLPNFANTVLADNDYTNATERTDFSKKETISKLWKAEVTENNTTGTTYYFTGNPNNWVSFAGYLWRVIRINEDGSVRLLYAGSGGEDGYIGERAYNSMDNHPGYVGFRYALGDTLEGTRGTTESVIYGKLNAWYYTNIVSKNDGSNSYDDYVSENSLYCNDRELAPGSSFTTGSSTFHYATNGRLVTNKTPTYNCTNEGDRFTGSNLTHPVGLMTADEISFAGGVYGKRNSSAYYYLNKDGGSATGDKWWWTMSPAYWWGSSVRVFRVAGSYDPGQLNVNLTLNTEAVRPVISLKGCSLFNGGTGTGDDPYTVTINGNCALEENTNLAKKIIGDNGDKGERTNFNDVLK